MRCGLRSSGEGAICIPVGDKSRWAWPPRPMAAPSRGHCQCRRMNLHGSEPGVPPTPTHHLPAGVNAESIFSRSRLIHGVQDCAMVAASAPIHGSRWVLSGLWNAPVTFLAHVSRRMRCQQQRL
jgi:hypothetical protein